MDFIKGIIKNKKFISFAIIFCALIISGFLVFGGRSDKKNDELNTFIQKIDSENKIPSNLTFETNPLENMTLKFASNLANAALNKNFYQDELKRPAIINPKDTSVIKNTISKIIDDEFNTPVIKKSDIVVNDKNSPEIQKLYLLYLNQVISDIPTFGAVDENADIKDTFTNVANNLETAIQLLKIVHVPPSWVDIHYKILTLLTHQRNIFISLTKNVDDPLRFLTALYQIKDDPFKEGLKIIQIEIERKIKNEKLI